MIEIEVVIIIVIAIAVWLFIHFRKKGHSSVAESGVKPVAAKTILPEPISEPKVEAKLEAIIQEPAVETKTSEVADVIPEDSTLRRHYLQNLSAQAGSSTDIAEAVINKEEIAVSVPEDSAVEVTAVETGSVSSIPQDAVLRRHFVQQLTAETEAEMPDRPTDSTLKRHYDAQLLSSVSSKLEAMK